MPHSSSTGYKGHPCRGSPAAALRTLSPVRAANKKTGLESFSRVKKKKNRKIRTYQGPDYISLRPSHHLPPRLPPISFSLNCAHSDNTDVQQPACNLALTSSIKRNESEEEENTKGSNAAFVIVALPQRLPPQRCLPALFLGPTKLRSNRAHSCRIPAAVSTANITHNNRVCGRLPCIHSPVHKLCCTLPVVPLPQSAVVVVVVLLDFPNCIKMKEMRLKLNLCWDRPFYLNIVKYYLP